MKIYKIEDILDEDDTDKDYDDDNWYPDQIT